MSRIVTKLRIGEAMEMFREDKGWNVAEMAEFLGIDRCHYYRLMKPSANPRLSTVYNFLREAIKFEATVTCARREDDHYHLIGPDWAESKGGEGAER